MKPTKPSETKKQANINNKKSFGRPDFNPHYFRRTLAVYMEVQRTSQRQLAKKLNMGSSALTLALQGKRRFKDTEILTLSQILQVPWEELAAAAGFDIPKTTSSAFDQTPIKIPVVGWVGADFCVQFGAVKGPASVPCPPGGQHTQALRFQTSNTSWQWLDGGIVYYRPIHGKRFVSVPIPSDTMGRPSVIEFANGLLKLGVLRLGYEEHTYMVENLGREIIGENVRVKSASRIIWIQT